jgi:SAM-dependent methyltransferase
MQTKTTDLYANTYSRFSEQVLDQVRKDTYGDDFGQNSWVTLDEYDRWLPLLNLGKDSHILEVATGSGGPALHVASTIGCTLTGIDANQYGVTTAIEFAAKLNVDRARFLVADATARLPFEDATFDGLLCIDAMNHLVNRLEVLTEWRRVLRPGARALFTDPVVIGGPVTKEELAIRSSIGSFLFVPPGANEQLIEQAGLQLISQEDVTENAALVSGRWHDSRARHKEDLIAIEDEERFSGLQEFFAMVHLLTSERRLLRIAYLVERPA